MDKEISLDVKERPAILPPLTENSKEVYEGTAEEPLRVIPVVHRWARVALVAVALGLIVVFAIAIYLNPYQEDGEARTMETHRQLGLPPCNFKVLTNLPCPSCGMTTSFSLLVRGDVWHSVQANFVGTLLATFCLLFIPWAFASAYLGRPLFILSIENTLVRLIIVFVVLMVGRWLVIVAVSLWLTPPS